MSLDKHHITSYQRNDKNNHAKKLNPKRSKTAESKIEPSWICEESGFQLKLKIYWKIVCTSCQRHLCNHAATRACFTCQILLHFRCDDNGCIKIMCIHGGT